MNYLVFETMKKVLEYGALVIRDVDNGEEPFLYASGNWGPGYVSIKGLVSKPRLFESMTLQLASKISYITEIDIVAGNVTGGVPPSVLLSKQLSIFYGKDVPLLYVRDARKKGGMKELVTGHRSEYKRKHVLVTEELVNFAQTTCNSVNILREMNYYVDCSCCILFYNNPVANEMLYNNKITIIYLFTLSELLYCAESCNYFSKNLIDKYRNFLEDPLDWQKKKGLEPVKGGGTK